MGGVETSKSLIRVCLASEQEGEPRANDQVIFIWMNIYSEIVIQVADSQQERRPSWRKCWRGEREGDETRIVSVISSRGRGCPRSFVSHALHSASRQAPWSTTTRARWAVLCGDKIRYVAYAFHNVCS